MVWEAISKSDAIILPYLINLRKDKLQIENMYKEQVALYNNALTMISNYETNSKKDREMLTDLNTKISELTL